MKTLDELILPHDLRYTRDHEWARVEGDLVRVGITDYAQDQLGDVVYVELPEPGQTFARGEAFGTVESVKAVSELYLPVGGEIVEVNAGLSEAPQLVNESPYDRGWMVVVRPSDPAEIKGLLDVEAYREHLKGIE
ncbi:glycine cleavage system protein GcvH [Deferrisoma camini]|uniref:glycine cleavage system protein GcvH n=1 Tax=Deferrisoma camini TaxID=1035120 RepID=UPI00046CFF20|nr:glycine cleavage system protein GcvH [Deferrisoma camini]